ncbi:sigma factor [Spirosoma rigui]|uniref:sigma factor n=1 Tax=Spirosoma rigui TaxID=564064 RepID=UPI0009B0EFEF|nr:sigma factor [Spirosoma rigui]
MNATRPTESSAVRALQTHSAADFSLLYDAYSPALYGFLLRLVNDPVRAQQLLQHTFMTIWSSSQQYDPQQGSVLSWMLAITRNTAMNVATASQVSTTVSPAQSRLTGSDTAPAGAASALRPPYSLAYQTSVTGREPAPNALKTRLQAGLQQLKNYFSLNGDQYMADSQA